MSVSKLSWVVNEESLLGSRTVFICPYYSCPWASQVEQWLKICLPMQEAGLHSLGWEDPLEEERATHLLQCSCLKSPWAEEPGGLQSMGSHRVGQD